MGFTRSNNEIKSVQGLENEGLIYRITFTLSCPSQLHRWCLKMGYYIECPCVGAIKKNQQL